MKDKLGRFIKGFCPVTAFKKGHKMSYETRKKISISLKGNKAFWFGKHLSQITKNKISRANKGKPCPNFKGGIIYRKKYIKIYLPKHKFSDKQGYVCEHRLVVEKIIGRYLLPKEQVHHINKIKDDNRPQNLMAFINQSSHMRFEKNCPIKATDIIFDGRKYI